MLYDRCCTCADGLGDLGLGQDSQQANEHARAPSPLALIHPLPLGSIGILDTRKTPFGERGLLGGDYCWVRASRLGRR